MKTIRFETTFCEDLRGSKHLSNRLKSAFVEIPAPDNIDELELDISELTGYIEETTGLFVFSLEVIETKDNEQYNNNIMKNYGKKQK